MHTVRIAIYIIWHRLYYRFRSSIQGHNTSIMMWTTTRGNNILSICLRITYNKKYF